MPKYNVTLSLPVEADDPLDAVEGFIFDITDSGLRHHLYAVDATGEPTKFVLETDVLSYDDLEERFGEDVLPYGDDLDDDDLEDEDLGDEDGR